MAGPKEAGSFFRVFIPYQPILRVRCQERLRAQCGVNVTPIFGAKDFREPKSMPRRPKAALPRTLPGLENDLQSHWTQDVVTKLRIVRICILMGAQWYCLYSL